MRHREANARRSAVVENVESVLREMQRVGEGFDGFRQRVEGVDIVARGWNFGEAEAGQIRRDDAIPVGEARNQLAILKRRSREAVEEKNNGRVWIASFTI